MRLPQLSASIDRISSRTFPPGSRRGEVQPRSKGPACEGSCDTNIDCAEGCKCVNATCVEN